MDKEDVERIYSIAFPDAEEKSVLQETVEKIQECGIKDSGARRQFDTGAVRDIQEGKGRCDLLPLDVIALMYYEKSPHPGRGHVFDAISKFMTDGNFLALCDAIEQFMLGDAPFGDCNWATIYLEVSKHFEEGCKKYGENNWQKGIPTHCYIDSAVRHYLKWLRGDKDEPHDRAFCWNILCCIWTCIHKPELNDYAKKDTTGMCVVCGNEIPEGRQVCPNCQVVGGDQNAE